MKYVLSFLLSLLATNCFSQKIFADKHFGFSIAEPKSWIIESNNSFIDSLFKANIDIDTADIIDQSEGSLLLARFQKYGVNKTGFIPVVEIKVLNNQTLSFEDFTEDIKASSNEMKAQYKDFTFINEAQQINLNGYKAIYFSGKFSLIGTKSINIEAAGQKIKGNKSYEIPLQTKMYAIPFGKYFIQLAFVTILDDATDEQTFDTMIKSIKIGK